MRAVMCWGLMMLVAATAACGAEEGTIQGVSEVSSRCTGCLPLCNAERDPTTRQQCLSACYETCRRASGAGPAAAMTTTAIVNACVCCAKRRLESCCVACYPPAAQ